LNNVDFFSNFAFKQKRTNMSKGTKIALITLGALVIGVGVYMLISKSKNKSGNKEKDDRDIVVKRT
jgi:hypothetical protein